MSISLHPLVAGDSGDDAPTTVLCCAGALLEPVVVWQSAARALAAQAPVTVIAVDWLDTEESTDLACVADRLARLADGFSGRVVLAGQSAGGVLCLLAALARPAAVTGCVVSNTGASTRGHGDPALPRRLARQWESTVRALVDSCLTDPGEWPQLRQSLCEHALGYRPAAAIEATTSLRELDLAARLPRLGVPTLVAHGSADQRRSIAHARELADLVPRSRLALIDAAHLPMVEQPWWWAGLVAEFLADLPRPLFPHQSAPEWR